MNSNNDDKFYPSPYRGSEPPVPDPKPLSPEHVRQLEEFLGEKIEDPEAYQRFQAYRAFKIWHFNQPAPPPVDPELFEGVDNPEE